MENQQPTTLPDQAPNRQPISPRGTRAKYVVTVIILLVVAFASSVAVYYWKNTEVNELKSQNSVLQAKNAKTDASKDTPESKDPVSTVSTVGPIIGFEPSGKFTQDEKNELRRKIIEPMYDYAPDQAAAIYIEYYDPSKFVNPGDHKYIITALGKVENQGSGFLTGSKKTGTIDWWSPTCMSDCQFSNEYAAKYPEVVKLSAQ